MQKHQRESFLCSMVDFGVPGKDCELFLSVTTGGLIEYPHIERNEYGEASMVHPELQGGRITDAVQQRIHTWFINPSQKKRALEAWEATARKRVRTLCEKVGDAVEPQLAQLFWNTAAFPEDLKTSAPALVGWQPIDQVLRTRLKLALGTDIPYDIRKCAEDLYGRLDAIRVGRDTSDHETEFLSKHGTEYEIVALLSNGNLTMNGWFVAYLAPETAGGLGRIVRVRSEPLGVREYTCIVKENGGGTAVRRLRFHPGRDQRVVTDAQTAAAADITRDVRFATYGQQIVRNGQITSMALLLPELSGDYRHPFRPVDINIPEGKVTIYGQKWFGRVFWPMRELQNDVEMARAAYTGPIGIECESEELRERIVRILEAPGSGYRYVTEGIPRLPGEFQRDSDPKKIYIYLARNVYAFTAIGVKTDGSLVHLAVTGQPGKHGVTLEAVASNLLLFGAFDGILIDEGYDVTQIVRENGPNGEPFGGPTLVPVIEPQPAMDRFQVRSMFIVARKKRSSSRRTPTRRHARPEHA